MLFGHLDVIGPAGTVGRARPSRSSGLSRLRPQCYRRPGRWSKLLSEGVFDGSKSLRIGFVVIAVSMMVGAAMALWPQTLWWIFESWKFRNLEANKPSDAVYVLTQASGVILAAAGLLFGIALIGDERDARRERQAEEAAAKAEADFVAPPAGEAGMLPMIGHYVDPTATKRPRIEAYFIVPEDSWAVDMRRMSVVGRPFSRPCYYQPRVADGPDGRVVAGAELIWAPQRLSDMGKAGGCFLGPKHKIDEVRCSRPTELVVVTNEKIVDDDGAEIVAAAPGNVLPRLSGPIEGKYARTTASARGAIPIVGYQLGAGGELEIDYLQPNDTKLKGREDQRYRGAAR